MEFSEASVPDPGANFFGQVAHLLSAVLFLAFASTVDRILNMNCGLVALICECTQLIVAQLSLAFRSLL